VLNSFVIAVILALLSALSGLLNSAESLTRWSTADGYDCWSTDNTGNYTCCKKITVVIAYVTLVADRCVDCYDGGHGQASCGAPYHVALDLNEDQPVNPKVQNYAKDLIENGLDVLYEETQENRPLDPNVQNNAKAMIEDGLNALGVKNETQQDSNVDKVEDSFIDKKDGEQKNKTDSGSNVSEHTTDSSNSDSIEENTEAANSTSGISERRQDGGNNKGTGNSADQSISQSQ
jgi:hypothetical protein